MCGAATLIDPTGWPLDGVHFVITLYNQQPITTYIGGSDESSEQCDASFALWEVF